MTLFMMWFDSRDKLPRRWGTASFVKVQCNMYEKCTVASTSDHGKGE